MKFLMNSSDHQHADPIMKFSIFWDNIAQMIETKPKGEKKKTKTKPNKTDLSRLTHELYCGAHPLKT